MPTKPIVQSITLWSALAMLVASLLRQVGVDAEPGAIEQALLLLIQVGGALIVIWRRLRDPKPLRGWK